MGVVIGRDYNGNSVAFEADTRPVESDAALKAENAAAGGATTAKVLTVSGALTASAALTANGAFTTNALATIAGGLALGTVPTLTAGTTQTLAGATALSTVSVVNAATLNDGVKFNVAASGSGRVFIVISVGSTATMKIWPNLADAIDAGSAGAAVTLTAAHRCAVFIDTAANVWSSFLLGAVAS